MRINNRLLQVLRETKAELKEQVKMLRYYGASGNVICDFLNNVFIPTASLRKGLSYNKRRVYENQVSRKLQDKLLKISELNNIKKNLFSDPPSIVFISYTIPRIDSTSSELRLFNILKILLCNNCRVDFLYCEKLWNEEKYIKSFKGNIEFKHLPIHLKNYEDFIVSKQTKYVWITEIWRIEYAKFISVLTENLKQRPLSSHLIIDTVDFHYKEFYRKYELTKNDDDIRRANTFLGCEETLYRNADIVVVISEDEKGDIERKISGIKKIEIVPNIHEIKPNGKSFYRRRHMCFLGHFGNKHNVDAVKSFLQDIWPHILKKNPGLEFHVIGINSDRWSREFKSRNVKVVGKLKYLENALENYRLFVCPMSYGAGMKGKIGNAIAAGVPVVATSVGAEGFPFKDGEECFIEDNPINFAQKCNRILADETLWNVFSVKSKLMIAEKFSPGAVSLVLKQVLWK